MDEAPAGTVTELGTAIAALVELIATVIPEIGATPLRVTAPIESFPPTTEEGARVTELNVGAATVKLDDLDDPPPLAVNFTYRELVTPVVGIAKEVLVDPEAIVTLAGGVAQLSFDITVTTKPPVGAFFEIKTVPVADVPPPTDVGEIENDETV